MFEDLTHMFPTVCDHLGFLLIFTQIFFKKTALLEHYMRLCVHMRYAVMIYDKTFSLC